MATVTFSAADDVLYAYLAGEIDHDAAQGLRIQLDDALLTRSPAFWSWISAEWDSWIRRASG